ncbi:MAG: hypothetical protein V2I35_07315 [Desulfocapsaceae bacterium]|jgi:hypothetical protein|nr:hypothetical protein [Desulfocapsaceae bacterium]
MNGLDQVVVVMWFIPVVLFIVIPLCLTVFWAIASFFLSIFKTAGEQEKREAEVGEAATA